jgi:hypothetical protein
LVNVRIKRTTISKAENAAIDPQRHRGYASVYDSAPGSSSSTTDDMTTLLLIHGELWEEGMDAERFWRRPGIVARLKRAGFAVLAPGR